jgi:hypothetical protein
LGAGTEEKWRKEFLDHKTGTLEAAMKGIWENWGKWYPLKRQIALNNICRCFRPYCCYSLSTVKFGNLRGKTFTSSQRAMFASKNDLSVPMSSQ